MLKSLRNRLLIIALLVICSCLTLYQNYRRTSGPDRTGQPVSLGLDLQGGMHLGLELDESERRSDNRARDIELALKVLRKRIDEFGFSERVIQQVGDHRLVVELPGVQQPERAREIVQRSAFLEFRLTDRSNALERALPAIERGVGPISLAARPGPGTIPGQYLVAASNWQRVDSLLRQAQGLHLWPRGVTFRWAGQAPDAEEPYRAFYVLDERPVITGASLVDAQAQLDPMTGGPEVVFQLDHAGGKKFGEATSGNIGNYLAILLDDKVQGAPPVIEGRIDRSGRIQMTGRTITQAQDLALTLRAGALPIPLKIVEERLVGPSLGADSIQGGILAGLVGTALVVLIMTGYYALSGVLAVAALGLYSLFTLAGLSFVGATLTLPGLAGFVLSIGFAVDANVLIFERIREELAAGRRVQSAVDTGFRHAMPAIIDSNLTTVLTALFLFQFGTGPVKGFAATLVIGILASMLTAVFVTRTGYLLWLRARPGMTSLSLGRVRLFRSAAFDFIRRRHLAYALTLLFVAAGIGSMLTRRVNYGVEFTGGTLIQVHTDSVIPVQRVRDALRASGIPGAEIQRYGSDHEFIVRAGAGAGESTDQSGHAAGEVRSALEHLSGPGSYQVIRVESVGPKVGGELRQQAFLAIGLSFVAVLAYLAWRFEWRFGVAAVLATAHDIVATLAFIALLRLEVGLVVVAALLTVVGYSLNDTIVIFDRIREQLRNRSPLGSIPLLNRAINETLPRTMLTGGTALATLLALALFGGEVIRPFALVMFFGIFTGTFSSMFIAAPVLLWIERRWPAHPAPGAPGRAILIPRNSG